jgi:hypothetical protein
VIGHIQAVRHANQASCVQKLEISVCSILVLKEVIASMEFSTNANLDIMEL